jgi:hypothetical protein
MRAGHGLRGAVEKYLDLVTPHNCKNRRRICGQASALSIPIAGCLKAENVAVILGCSHQVRYGELWHCGN